MGVICSLKFLSYYVWDINMSACSISSNFYLYLTWINFHWLNKVKSWLSVHVTIFSWFLTFRIMNQGCDTTGTVRDAWKNKQERMAFHRGGLLLLISHEISYQSIHELHTGINMTKLYNVKIKLNSRTVKYDRKGLYLTWP